MLPKCHLQHMPYLILLEWITWVELDTFLPPSPPVRRTEVLIKLEELILDSPPRLTGSLFTAIPSHYDTIIGGFIFSRFNQLRAWVILSVCLGPSTSFKKVTLEGILW